MKVVKTVVGARAARGRGLTLACGTIDFPFGRAFVAVSGTDVCWVGFGGALDKVRSFFPGARIVRDDAAVRRAVKSGRLALHGTAFQVSVWKELLKIRRGTTRTYRDIATAIGKPQALRAVGSAVGANPLSVLVPCHRIINTSGAIDKYAWGAAVKRRLLTDEGAL